ncbi:MAG: lysoplasmalogenase [Saprospiraceae bacterium]
MRHFASYFLLLFVVAAGVCLSGEWANYAPAVWFSKPLLMPALLLWIWSQVPERSGPFRALLWSLTFATAGDVLLMFAGRGAKGGAGWFEAGIGAFLLAQCAYIAAFRQMAAGRIAVWRRSPWLTILLTVYVFALMCLILPAAAAALRGPVLVYGFSLYGAALMALNLRGANGAETIFAGMTLFVISDSLIAINRFVQPLPAAGVWIMATYIVGQFLIVKGTLRWFACKGI